jgi:hypothetical protein
MKGNPAISELIPVCEHEASRLKISVLLQLQEYEKGSSSDMKYIVNSPLRQ